MAAPDIHIGTAGWSIPKAIVDRFPGEGSGLEKYAAVFDVVEINSTFYRSHRGSTYSRWMTSTPDGFRFSVKTPRAITHDARLVDVADAMPRFLSELDPLRAKLGVLLVQLPPGLAFDPVVAEAFFGAFRAREHELRIACEPRHGSWFSTAADGLLSGFQVARVAADPAPHTLASEPGGWKGFAYFRLHGAPRMYHSAYGPESVRALARRLERTASNERWCIFDNTARGAAAEDARELMRVMGRATGRSAFTPTVGAPPARVDLDAPSSAEPGAPREDFQIDGARSRRRGQSSEEVSMAELKTRAREKLPAKDFAEPDKRAYPIEDKPHARNAKARASQAVKAGRMSKAEAAKIDKKADAVIKGG